MNGTVTVDAEFQHILKGKSDNVLMPADPPVADGLLLPSYLPSMFPILTFIRRLILHKNPTKGGLRGIFTS